MSLPQSDGVKTAYMFSGTTMETEWERLDYQHQGFLHYMNGKVTFAPLDSPSTILDMGAGTGAWAAEAARQYPDAAVLAVDMNTLPDHSFPPNMQFQQLNLLHNFPWPNESFDVIHLRLILWHMPNATRFLERVTTLLKPNGWLLIEDTCIMDSPRAYGPAQKKRTEVMTAFMTAKDLDAQIGANAADFVCKSFAFSEVNIRQQLLTYLPLPEDPLVRPLAETMRNSIIRATTRSLSSELVAAGMTPELQKTWEAEMNDTRYDPMGRYYFVWARKRVLPA